MTQPLTRAHHPFTQDADLVRVLDSLPESLLLAAIHDRVAVNDLSWLERMVHAGFFQASQQEHTDGTDSSANLHNSEGLYEKWQSRCKAMLGVMDQAQMRHPEPCSKSFITNDDPDLRVVFELPTTSKDFFAMFCQYLGEQALAWQVTLKYPLEIDLLMTQAMGLVAMLDRADVLASLASAFPKSVNQYLEEKHLGKGMFAAACETPVVMDVSPLFCALQFSGPDCVQVLTHLYDKNRGLYDVWKADNVENIQTIGLLRSFDHMCHRGQPEAMTPLITMLADLAREGPVYERKNLNTIFGKLMQRQSRSNEHRNARMLPAFVDAGVADFDPTKALVQGVMHNRLPVLEHFRGRIDWTAFASVSSDCMEAFTCAIEKHMTEGLSCLMAQAKDSGHGKDFLNAFVQMPGGALMHGLAKALVTQAAGVDVLARVFDLGLDPDARTADGIALTSLAENAKFGALEIIHSFKARRLARALIHEIEDSEPASPPRSTKNNPVTP